MGPILIPNHECIVFTRFILFFSQYGLTNIFKNNQKLAVLHVLWDIRPKTPLERLEDDLHFCQQNLKKHLNIFSAYASKVSEAFQILDTSSRSIQDGWNTNSQGDSERTIWWSQEEYMASNTPMENQKT